MNLFDVLGKAVLLPFMRVTVQFRAQRGSLVLKKFKGSMRVDALPSKTARSIAVSICPQL